MSGSRTFALAILHHPGRLDMGGYIAESREVKDNKHAFDAGRSFQVPMDLRQASILLLIASIILCAMGAAFTCSNGLTGCFLMFAAIPCVAGIGSLYQFVATVWDKWNYGPPGKMVEVNGRLLHINHAGSGSPTVVLEAGLGAMSSGWGWIQPEVAKFTRVVSYDREGLGWSEGGSGFTSASNAVNQLNELLQTSSIEGPYVLVGHSMGGLLVRVFANKYPEKVAGIVLVDASHPDQYTRSHAIRRHMNAGFRMLKKIPFLTKMGYVRLTRFLHSQAEGLPVRQRREAEVFLTSYTHLKATLNESRAWDTICEEVRHTRHLGNLPLAVVSAGKDVLPGSGELQAELAAISSDSAHQVVEGATHVTLVTHRGHAMSVVAAVRQVVEKAAASCAH